jgi:signal transduction histidine kinase
VNTMRSKPPIPGLLVPEALSDGAMNTARQICNGCKVPGPLAIMGRMAQSVSHDLRNNLSAIYCNVEFMSESRTTQPEREKLLQDVHAVVQDMTGMLDSLLLIARTGQTLHPRFGIPERNGCPCGSYGPRHPDARSVDLVIHNVASVTGWIDCTKLGSAVYNLLLNASQAARLGLAPRRVRVTITEDQGL